MTGRTAVIIAAAGSGERMGGVRKQFMLLAGRPLLMYSLEIFQAVPHVEWITVALPHDDVADPPEWLRALSPAVSLVAGGANRGESVYNALRTVPAEADVVLVHDAARPLFSRALVTRVIEEASRGHGVVPALPVSDTIKRVAADHTIVQTPDRAELWSAQTPQGFPRSMLVEAHARAHAGNIVATDDASLVEECGGKVVVVPGERANMKVTTEADLLCIEVLFGQTSR